jgi:hypothetical protein
MERASGKNIKVCNLLKGGPRNASECIIYSMQSEFLIWTWFDKYIVRHPQMGTFSELKDIYSIDGIKSLFNRSKKFRDDINFRPTAQKYFKMCFKSRGFSLKLEDDDVSVVSKVSNIDTLSKSLKGYYTKLHPGQPEVFQKYKYHSLLEDEDKDVYVLYGPLSYVNHSCSAMIRLPPPDKDNVKKEIKLQVPFHKDDVNSSVMQLDKCRIIKSVVSEDLLEREKIELHRERALAKKEDLNPFGKILTGTNFEIASDNAVIKGVEFNIRYANYIPRTWFKCKCQPEQNCCQYDYRYIENKENKEERSNASIERSSKRTRLC